MCVLGGRGGVSCISVSLCGKRERPFVCVSLKGGGGGGGINK